MRHAWPLLLACSASPATPVPPDLGPCLPFSLDSEPTSPVDFGRRAIDDALAKAGISDQVELLLDAQADPRPESYSLQPGKVIAHDEVGLMYGALDVADAIRQGVPVQASVHAPAMEIRAANLFLVLPARTELTWWLRDPMFWKEYLDLLARSRFNVLDAHGMYDPNSGDFSDALPYFSDACNRAALHGILAMAKARGIRVGLMTYGAGDASSTHAAATDLATTFPSLAWLGFRIGETSHDAAFYESTFIAGVREAQTGIPIATRTWGATKADILAIAALGGPDTIVEAKLNGEHVGAPYVIAGGSFTRWPNYSYEDYLSPPAPYRFVFQARSAGTHRGFRFASFERARRLASSLEISPQVRGVSFEPGHAYAPQTDAFAANVAERFSPWTFRRDELSLLMLGRLSYDPTTPEEIFRAALLARTGTDALWDPVQAASDIVPWIQVASTCGPDGTDFAPDLEWGGPVAYWASPPDAPTVLDACKKAPHGPFDTFAVASPFDTATDLVAGRPTSRVSSLEVARIVLDRVDKARAAAPIIDAAPTLEALDYARECVALSDLGEYFAHKLRAATLLAVYERTARTDYLAAARAEIALADDGWRALARDTSYIAPFLDPIRMAKLGLGPFHWRAEIDRLPEDPASIDAIESVVRGEPSTGVLPSPDTWLAMARGDGPGLASLVAGRDVTVRFASEPASGSHVSVLYKPFSGYADWTALEATRDGAVYRATAPDDRGLFAVEVSGWRYPDVLVETPYVARAP